MYSSLVVSSANHKMQQNVLATCYYVVTGHILSSCCRTGRPPIVCCLVCTVCIMGQRQCRFCVCFFVLWILFFQTAAIWALQLMRNVLVDSVTRVLQFDWRVSGFVYILPVLWIMWPALLCVSGQTDITRDMIICLICGVGRPVR